MTNDLKILVITPFYRHFVKELVDAMSQEVFQTNILLHCNLFTKLSQYLPFSYFRWVDLFSKKNLIHIESKPNNVKINLITNFYFIPDGRNFGLGDKLEKEFSNYIRKNKIKFDLIHAHFTWPQGYVAVKLGKEFSVPTILTVHEERQKFLSDYRSKNQKIYWTWSNVDAIIRVNRSDCDLLNKFNSNVFYIPNGFSREKFPIINEKYSKSIINIFDKKLIFSFGYLIERKGFQYLIEAMSMIVKDRKDVVCIIGGKGPYENKLKNMIKDLKLNEYVKLVGYISAEDLPFWLNACDVFVLPSISEGNPTVMFEALGVGAPFVGSKVGGVPDIITSDDYGLLVEPGNSNDLVEKLQTALNKQWDKKKIQGYAQQFNWGAIAKQVLNVYEGILGKSH